MKHEEVVAALKLVAEKGKVPALSATDKLELVKYNLIAIEKGQEKERNPVYILTKKGRVMLKANTKPAASDPTAE